MSAEPSLTVIPGGAPYIPTRAVARRIVAMGVSHHTAPLEVRECAALDEDAIRAHLRALCAEVCEEALLLSTCNRVELYAVVREDAVHRLRAWFHRLHGGRVDVFDPHLRTWEQGEAVGHLFQVAASLDSLVLGEPQILGQVKKAVRLAEEAGSLGRILGRAATRALSVGKRVRSETAIGGAHVGVGSAGADLARRVLGELEGRSALLVGVGEMGRQVAKALLGSGLSRLSIANRTLAHAEALAQSCGGEAIPFDQVEHALSRVDVVITATSASAPILGPAEVRRALRARRYRPLFLLDLAVPRNIDPAVAELEDAYLFDVDDLGQVLEEGREARELAAQDALRIVEQETARFVTSLREVEVGPAIGQITRGAEAIRQAELARSRRLVDALDAEQREQLDAMSRALTKKVLDGPLRAIREAARSGDAERLEALLAQWDVG